MLKASKFTFLTLVLFFSSQIFAQNVLGPKNYSASPQGKTTTEAFTASAINSHYKLSIKNGDGLDHSQKNCSGLSGFSFLICKLDNVVNQVYVDLFRVQSGELRINDQIIFDNTKINKNMVSLETTILLQSQNTLKVFLKGQILAKLTVSIEKTTQSTDTTAPLIISSLSSNSLTNQNHISINITDESAVTTYVWDNNQNLLFTSTAKNFSVPLIEGTNNFVIQSKDSYGNTSDYFYLNQIVSDRTPANITYQVASEYIYNSYPQNLTLNFNSNEPLSFLKVNGFAATQVSPTTYQLILSIDVIGTKNFMIDSQDLAGNFKTENFNIIFNLDNTPPALTSSLASNSYINQNKIHIAVTDSANVSTEVYKEGVLQATLTNKEFDLTLTEGINNFTLKSKDQYGNQAVDFKLENINLDTQKPIITNNAKLKYYYKNLPAIQDFSIYTNETLQQLSINGINQLPVADKTYNYQAIFTAAQNYSLAIKAIDLAGNETILNLTVSVIIDQAPPEIVLPQNIPAIVTTNSYTLPVQINDLTAVNTVVSVDGQAVLQTQEKFFEFTIPFLQDENKTVQIISSDEALNQSVKIFSMKRDTSPLNLEFISPQAFSNYPSKTVQVRLRANKPIQSATLNDSAAVINSDQISFGQNIEVIADGLYTFKATVTDITGVSKTATVTFEIKSRSIASWEYQECPAN